MLHSNIIGKGNKKPLLILHGFLGMGDNWKTLAKKISEHGFELHLIDARNHGRSFHHSDFNYEVMVEDLKNYCDQMSIETFDLLGHSMGGKTAMLFAVNYANYVSKLVVVDIAPRYYPIHHQDILEGLSKIDDSSLESRTDADEILSDYVNDMGTRQFLLKNLYWTNAKKLSLRINLPILREKVAEVGEALPTFSTFGNKTLFIKGGNSEYIAISDELEIKRHFPNSDIKSIPSAGHWLHAEKPDEFLEMLLSFLLN